jgi:dienelactone hydrolase
MRLALLSASVLSMFLPWSVTGCAGAGLDELPAPASVALTGPSIASLERLSINALKVRRYGSNIEFLEKMDRPCTDIEASELRINGPRRYMASYMSEGLRIYARIDIPSGPAPESGFPVIIFAHGWVGAEDAPSWHFGCSPKSIYGDMISAWTSAGYVVLVPGYRGHGTVAEIQADGFGDMQAWDNAAYLMPSFYAVDVLNLIAGIGSALQLPEDGEAPTPLDRSRFFIDGHSQGGDVALTALAVAGEGADPGIDLAGGAIWSGNIPDRFTQLATFRPMQEAPEAFLSGDGTWTGRAESETGKANPDFVFGYPSEWIETPNPEDWTWQAEAWSTPRVVDVLQSQAEIMYGVLNRQVDDLGTLTWAMTTNSEGAHIIEHDPRLELLMSRIGGFEVPQYLTEPLNLHFSDHDFYSLPVWNEELCARVLKSGGACHAFPYSGNSHSMKVSGHEWFSPAGTVSGYEYIIDRDLALFSEADPDAIPFP